MKNSLLVKIVLIEMLWFGSGFFNAWAQNLVPNPSFEEVTLSVPPINFMPARPATETDAPEYKVYIPDGWRIVSSYSRGYLPTEQGWGVAEDKAHSGKRSIFLSDAPAFPAWYSEDFTLEPNTPYLAEAFIENTGMRYHDFVRIMFSILDDNDNCLGYEEIVSARAEDKNIRSSDYGVKGWRHKQVYIRPRQGQVKMRIIIRLINTGLVYIDDISVRALTPEEEARLQPHFHQKTPVLETVSEQPRVKATGFYRVEQINGVWWLVDPEGRLTWSIGVQSIGNILWENPTLTKYIEEKYKDLKGELLDQNEITLLELCLTHLEVDLLLIEESKKDLFVEKSSS
ncbi:MAG: hypothetical protein ACE5NG_15470 [bacterium]